MRLLFTLIGYLSTATLLSAGLGMAFLWQTERLDDEKVFQIVALLHGVDLDEVGAEADPLEDQEAPPEELSLDQTRTFQQIRLRDHEVKEALLKRQRSEAEYWFEEAKAERSKLDRIAEQLNQQRTQESETLVKEGIENEVRSLESLDPRIAKDQLRRTLNEEESGVETVISLLNAMNSDKQRKILRTFTDEEELKDLHEILTEMRQGGARKELFDSYQGALNDLGDQ